MFNRVLQEGKVPPTWLQSVTTLLPKVPRPLQWAQTRPITLTNTLGKWLSQILLRLAGLVQSMPTPPSSGRISSHASPQPPSTEPTPSSPPLRSPLSWPYEPPESPTGTTQYVSDEEDPTATYTPPPPLSHPLIHIPATVVASRSPTSAVPTEEAASPPVASSQLEENSAKQAAPDLPAPALPDPSACPPLETGHSSSSWEVGWPRPATNTPLESNTPQSAPHAQPLQCLRDAAEAMPTLMHLLGLPTADPVHACNRIGDKRQRQAVACGVTQVILEDLQKAADLLPSRTDTAPLNSLFTPISTDPLTHAAMRAAHFLRQSIHSLEQEDAQEGYGHAEMDIHAATLCLAELQALLHSGVKLPKLSQTRVPPRNGDDSSALLQTTFPSVHSPVPAPGPSSTRRCQRELPPIGCPGHELSGPPHWRKHLRPPASSNPPLCRTLRQPPPPR